MEDLLTKINEIHIGCFQLCREALGEYLPVAGNIAIFTQSEDDFDKHSKLTKQITKPSDKPDQKYFQLIKPIVISQIGDIPETTYEYLYIRKPAIESPEVGDIDFVLDPTEYEKLKERILKGEKIPNAQIYNRPGWDMVELRSSKINALAYIGTKEMTEKVRVRF